MHCNSTVFKIIIVIYAHYRNYVNTKKDKNLYLLITLKLMYKSSIFFSLFLMYVYMCVFINVMCYVWKISRINYLYPVFALNTIILKTFSCH